MSKKRRLNGIVDQELAGLYDALAHEREATRLNAAQQLLSRYSVASQPSRAELATVFARLLRGLCSGRRAARLGYSVTLTEFLSLHTASLHGIKADDHPLHVTNVVRALGEQTQEQRDYYFGRVFGAEAIIKSGVLFASERDASHWERLLALVFEVVEQKAWLSEECGWVIYEALQMLKKHPSGTLFAQTVIDTLGRKDFLQTPEGVALWIAAERDFDGIKFPKSVFHHRDPLNRKECEKLASILKETGASQGSEQAAQTPQKGNWAPRLHVAWEVVFSALSQEVPEQVTFAQLWKKAVNDGLFARASTDQRKYWGFQLFLRHVRQIPAEQVRSVLSKNVLQCLVTQLSAKNGNLHELAERCQQALLARAKKNPKLILPVLTSIFKTRGLAHFDQITKTRTVEKLLGYADRATLPKLIPVLQDLLFDPRVKDEQSAARTRQAAADHLLAIVRLQNLSEKQAEKLQYSRATVDAALEALAICAYFENALDRGERTSRPFSPQTHEMLKSRLMSCLTYLLDKDAAPHHHLHRLATCLINRETQEQRASRMELAESLARPAALLRELHEAATSTGEVGDIYRAFELLLSLTILLIYNGESDAVEIADDLQECFTSLVANGKTLDDRDRAIEALLEIILGLLSKPSLLFRRMGQKVFPVIASSLNQQAVSSLIRVLETPEGAAGQSDLFDAIEENEDEEMVDASGSDVEEVAAENGTLDAEEGSEQDSGSEASEADDEATDEAAAFEAKLAQALGTRRADEDLNDPADESPDEDMDDEQMAALDGQIAAIFRQRNIQPNNNKKKKNRDAKTAIVQFKCRVLELLEIFVKKTPDSPVAVDLIRPLLDLIKGTSSKEARDKATKVLRDWLKVLRLDIKTGSPDAERLETARTLLRDVHGLAAQDGPNAYRSACSQASLLLVKTSLACGGTIEEAWQQYAETGSKFVTDPATSVKSHFFTDWLNWCVSAKQAYEKAARGVT